ncbi:MAG: 50S ribosomal protein L23 [Proteobacteria bacterium]|nr:50S ribosomal protein L23 [Pseudomonadota bacterium]
MAQKKSQTALKHYDVIRSPVVTEKSTVASDQGKITFKVSTDATKQDIKNAIESLFKVKVTKVNTINVEGKTKRFRGFIGKRNDFKKAVVTLAEGQSIDIMAGV